MATRTLLLATVAMLGGLSMAVPAFAADPAPAAAPAAPAATPAAAVPAAPAPAPAAAVSVAPAPAAAAPASPAAPVRLTGLAAWTTLVGNTVQGKVDGKDYWEFYIADGKVKSLTGANDLETGKWSVEGEKVCIVFPSEAKECYLVEVIGEVVNFTDEHGKGVRWAVMKGNPKSL